MSRSNFSFSKILFALIVFLSGMSVAFFIIKKQQTIPQNYDKLRDLIHYIDAYYVDTVNHKQLTEDAIRGILEHLDPHSTYSTAAENKAQTEVLDGGFEGVGVQFNIMNDTIMVVAAVSGGPSEKKGIRAGDRIVEVDGENVAAIGITNDRVFKLLRGKKGTEVKIGVVRLDVKGKLEFSIIRDVIPTHSVTSSYIIAPKTGYIKIDHFGATTVEEFEQALYSLKQKSLKKLILDLRGNSGGYLDACIKITDHFLAKNDLILSVNGLNTNSEEYVATAKGMFKEGNLIVLIDEFSASASEILAGAIQDNDRGTVMGRRSFGKGLVQRPFEFEDGSQVRLTVSRYYTPSGRSIQRDYKKGNDAYYEDLYDRMIEEENDTLVTKSHTLDKKEYFTKSGRVVYGGGGITPDFIIPNEKKKLSSAYYQVLNNTALIQFAFDFANKNKKSLTQLYTTPEAFISNLSITDEQLMEYLILYAKKSGRSIPQLNALETTSLKKWLKALIGRNLYQEEGFYPIINSMDNVIIEALKK